MAKKTESEYVILIEDETNGTFRVAGNVTVKAGVRASSAKKDGLAKFQPEGGTVVAIPVEDWTPEDLRPQLTFG